MTRSQASLAGNISTQALGNRLFFVKLVTFSFDGHEENLVRSSKDMTLSSLHRTKKRRGRYRRGYRVERIAAWAVLAAAMRAPGGVGPQQSTFAAATAVREPNMAPSPRLRRKLKEQNDSNDSRNGAKGDSSASEGQGNSAESKRRTKRKLFRLDEYMDSEDMNDVRGDVDNSYGEEAEMQEMGEGELSSNNEETDFWDRILIMEDEIFSMSMSFATAMKN